MKGNDDEDLEIMRPENDPDPETGTTFQHRDYSETDTISVSFFISEKKESQFRSLISILGITKYRFV